MTAHPEYTLSLPKGLSKGAAVVRRAHHERLHYYPLVCNQVRALVFGGKGDVFLLEEVFSPVPKEVFCRMF